MVEGEDHKVNPSKDHKQRSPKSDRTNSAFQSKVIKNPQKYYKYYILSRQFHRLTSSIVIKVIKPPQNTRNITFSADSFTGIQAAFQSRS